MDERDIMEVETPILSNSGNTDPNLISFKTLLHSPDNTKPIPIFLNTSPEFAMKRLLSAGSMSIYQVCKVFRDCEIGNFHEPEFTLLEWYRVGFNHHQLMNEMIELLKIMGYRTFERKCYAEIFEESIGLNPHSVDIKHLYKKAVSFGLQDAHEDRRSLLDFLFSHIVVPALSRDHPIFIYDFPVCQAALAQICHGVPAVAERFELFIDGLEIANGYHELCEAKEQRERFEKDNQTRIQIGLEEIKIDNRLLEALEQGLQPCAGVAIGLDRLLMKILDIKSLSDVMTFSHERS